MKEKSFQLPFQVFRYFRVNIGLYLLHLFYLNERKEGKPEEKSKELQDFYGEKIKEKSSRKKKVNKLQVSYTQ